MSCFNRNGQGVLKKCYKSEEDKQKMSNCLREQSV